MEQLLGDEPVPLLLGVGDAQQKHAVVFRLLGDHDIDRLTFAQVLDEFGVKFCQVGLRHNAIPFAADIDQQLRGTDLDNDALA